MRIGSSSVAMGSTRSYIAVRADLFSYSGWGNQTADSTLPTAKDSVQQTATESESGRTLNLSTKEMLDSLAREQKTIENRTKASEEQTVFVAKDPVEFDTFQNLMEMIFGVGRLKKDWVSEFRDLLARRKSDAYANFISGNPISAVRYGTRYQETHLYQEQESTCFYSSGKVMTEDGRKIDFDVSAYMSRSFCEYTNIQIDYEQAACVDPLVINLGSSTASVREQKFLFDLDCDGKQDSISMLSEMSGYLSLDKNEDGKINDGSELFGTKSGDGFGDLAVFDMDGNGWIDENDPVFNQLRIWTKDANGNDKLVGLGVAGVGAIYLGNVNTQYSLNSAETNQNNAQIRSTGIYLKENGEAGTIQHVDMSVSA